MIIITCLYPIRNTIRLNELKYVFEENIKLSCIEKIIVFFDNYNDNIKYSFLCHPKIQIIPSNWQKYNDLFSFANQNFKNKLICICNSDIIFDQTLSLINDVNENTVLSITRWDIEPLENKMFPVLQKDQTIAWSFDSYIFKSPLIVDEKQLIEKLDIKVGIAGCDTYLIKKLRDLNIKLYNPAFDIRTYHYHFEDERSRNISDESYWVKDDYKNIPGIPLTTLDGKQILNQPSLISSFKVPRKVIAFSLWGTKPIYNIGAIRNAELAQELFPGWECWYYIHAQNTDITTVEKLLKFKHVRIKLVGEFIKPMMWRFLTIDEPEVQVLICRDTDSRLSKREKFIVEEWLKSNKMFHIIRDHPHHQSRIFGGMYGIRKTDNYFNWTELINKFPWNNEPRNYDVDFLNNIIYPKIKNDCIIHDTFKVFSDENTLNLPDYDEHYHFIGEYIDEYERQQIHYTNILKEGLNKLYKNDFITGEQFLNLSNFIVTDKGKYASLNIKISPDKLIFIEDFDINSLSRLNKLNFPAIFVYPHLLSFFLRNILIHIKRKIQLITHNGDENITDDDLEIIKNSNKINASFHQNLNSNISNKSHLLPIGIANSQWEHGNLHILRKVIRKNITKDKMYYFNFNVNTNPKRIEIRNTLLNEGYIENKQSTFEDYLTELAQYRFCFCPEGNGVDTHRIWECLYLGVVPIVSRSIFSENLKKMGYPLLITDDWKTFTNEGKYEMKINVDDMNKKLSIQYYIQQIKYIKNNKLSCVVSATTSDSYYSDFVPTFIKTWKHFIPDIDIKIILIDDKIPDHLQRYKEYLIPFKIDGIDFAFIAQNIRLLYPCIIDTNGFVIITDIDIIPMCKEYYTTPLLYVDNDTFISYRNELISEKQLIMCYNSATPTTWKSIFNVYSIDDIKNTLINWYNSIDKNYKIFNENWTFDQTTLYNKVKEWSDKQTNGIYNNAVILSDDITKFKRLNRECEYDKTLNYTDFHMPRPYNENKNIINSALKNIGIKMEEENNKLISVIIPTYNRYNCLMDAIKSVVYQEGKHNIEIIIINDCSTDKRYENIGNDINKIIENSHNEITVHILRLDKNSKEIYNYPCAGFIRNIGLKKCTGDIITFLDDDDIWLPNKLNFQLDKINISGFVCSEGLFGLGRYKKENNYPLYNKQHYWNDLKSKLNLNEDFPDIWTYDFIKKHNSIICSSVMFTRNIFEKCRVLDTLPNGEEDYNYWLKILKNTDCVYIKYPCIYYDGNHGK